MAKDHKKKKKKKHVLDAAATSVRKFRRVTREIGKLNTAQKIIGGVALLAAGLAYLAKREADGAAQAAGSAELEDGSSAALAEGSSDAEAAGPGLTVSRHKPGKRRAAGKAHH